MAIKGFLFFLVLMPIFCLAQTAEKDSLLFSKVQWQQDTLGKYGYRRHIVYNTTFISELTGKTMEEVEEVLGLPDYYCRDGGGAYIYQYEFSNFKKKYKHTYTPKQDCDKYIETGSRIVFDFDEDTKRVFFIANVIVE